MSQCGPRRVARSDFVGATRPRFSPFCIFIPGYKVPHSQTQLALRDGLADEYNCITEADRIVYCLLRQDPTRDSRE